MPSIDTRTVTIRLQNRVLDTIEEKAKGRGLTVNAFFNELAREAAADERIEYVPLAVPGVLAEEAAEAPQDVEIPQGRLYGVALTLVDDLTAAGYPESEIEGVFASARREML